MATVTDAGAIGGDEEVRYAITSDVFVHMLEHGLIPDDRRVFLWGGSLYEKRVKTKAHSAVQNAFNQALARRVPPGLFVGNENPVRLDATHVPLPDLVVVRGRPLDYFDTRYPEGRDVVLVVEVSVASLPDDLGLRMPRYASALPLATYVVADISHRQILVHRGPRSATDSTGGSYEEHSVVRAGELLRLQWDDVVLEPIPYEELMR